MQIDAMKGELVLGAGVGLAGTDAYAATAVLNDGAEVGSSTPPACILRVGSEGEAEGVAGEDDTTDS
jgi:hypothetical protein